MLQDNGQVRLQDKRHFFAAFVSVMRDKRVIKYDYELCKYLKEYMSDYCLTPQDIVQLKKKDDPTGERRQTSLSDKRRKVCEAAFAFLIARIEELKAVGKPDEGLTEAIRSRLGKLEFEYGIVPDSNINPKNDDNVVRDAGRTTRKNPSFTPTGIWFMVHMSPTTPDAIKLKDGVFPSHELRTAIWYFTHPSVHTARFCLLGKNTVFLGDAVWLNGLLYMSGNDEENEEYCYSIAPFDATDDRRGEYQGIVLGAALAEQTRHHLVFANRAVFFKVGDEYEAELKIIRMNSDASRESSANEREKWCHYFDYNNPELTVETRINGVRQKGFVLKCLVRAKELMEDEQSGIGDRQGIFLRRE